VMDLICVVSACPYDLRIPNWSVNSEEKGPTELLVRFPES
jgi:uncharacterized protein YcgI (DUF1989 family)